MTDTTTTTATTTETPAPAPEPITVPDGMVAIQKNGVVVGYEAPPSPPQPLKRFLTSQIAPLIPDDEWLALINYAGTDPLVVALRDLVKTRNGWWDASTERYSATMAALVAEGVITQETADRFTHGIPA